ncbi:hypothetical protein JDV09_09580 [Mycobacterium sp. Y57]|uniref:hypothetical protein n=1 Tax=Mycolicibacterium xanthum TaxID=2796469 RepID=UPI001C84D6FD|nr:hypothetical protein [Mycolicibacterium xanthum]MBX7432353.1 hypothetical protein [Mycolicibacterium xanthum]
MLPWVTVAVLSLICAPSAHSQPHYTLVDLVDAATRRLQAAEPVVAAKFHSGAPVTALTEIPH